MTVRLDEQSNAALKAMKASFRLAHRMRDDGKEIVKAEIIDIVSGKAIAASGGPNMSEEDAIRKALAKATNAPKPQTPAQLAKENTALRKRLAELEVKASGTTTATAVGKDYAAMTGAELRAELESRDLPIQDGDIRSKEWQATARFTLEQDD